MKRTVGMYMHKHPITLEENSPMGEALELLDTHHITHILVTSNGKLTGVVSKQDLLEKAVDLLEHSSGRAFNLVELRTRNIAYIMGEDIITVSPDDSMDLGVELLLQNKFHCLPVVNEDLKPVGIITAFDLLKGYYQEVG